MRSTFYRLHNRISCSTLLVHSLVNNCWIYPCALVDEYDAMMEDMYIEQMWKYTNVDYYFKYKSLKAHKIPRMRKEIISIFEGI